MNKTKRYKLIKYKSPKEIISKYELMGDRIFITEGNIILPVNIIENESVETVKEIREYITNVILGKSKKEPLHDTTRNY